MNEILITNTQVKSITVCSVCLSVCVEVHCWWPSESYQWRKRPTSTTARTRRLGLAHERRNQLYSTNWLL